MHVSNNMTPSSPLKVPPAVSIGAADTILACTPYSSVKVGVVALMIIHQFAAYSVSVCFARELSTKVRDQDMAPVGLHDLLVPGHDRQQ